MKYILLITTLIFNLYATSLDDIYKQVNKDNSVNSLENVQRETSFLKDLTKAKKLLKESQKALVLEKKKTKKLRKDFESNKQKILKQNIELEKRSHNLKSLFTIAEGEARDFSSLLQTSMTTSQIKDRATFLQDLSNSHSIPSIEDIRKFWKLYLQEIIESGKITTYKTDLVNTNGIKSQTKITRVGLFSAFNADEYVRYDDTLGEFVQIMRQPSSKYNSYIKNYLDSTTQITPVLIDPTRGVLFHMLKEKATMLERIEQGGVIGYIILCLGFLSVLFSLYKYIKLSRTNSLMDKELKNLEKNPNNPLGRILLAFEKHKSKDINTIESKMDTAILKELPEIQSGLAMIKLVAAVAPLLGLLGTVTGMIETFQSITLFGTGDPKLMAGGISQALMTTVLGLVVAIPLLFIYNIVHAKSKKILEILTQQSSVLVAKQLEFLDEKTDELS